MPDWPLVEPIEDDRDHVRVTFVCDRDGLEQPIVAGGPAGADPRSEPLLERAEDGVWQLTLRLRADIRTAYAFAERRDRADVSRWWPDERNPARLVFPVDPEAEDEQQLVLSLLELPRAAPYRWSVDRRDVPRGQTEEHRVRSVILGNERRVFVHVPPGYDSAGRPYGLLVLFDGFAYVTLVPTPVVLDSLLAEGRIAPLVAVLPDSLDDETRMRELLGHEPFVEFLMSELLPWARERWNLTAEPERTIVGGSSAGGLTGALVALRRPDVFGNVLSQSGAFQWERDGAEPGWLMREFVRHDRHHIRLWLEAGILETLPYGERAGILAANRHMRDVLEAKGYDVTYREFPGGHDYACWRETLADGLTALAGDGRP